MEKIRVLVVDDEALGRERIIGLLTEAADVEVVGEAGDGVRALSAIDSLDPDLVFLDVRMPELDGLGVVEALEGERGPGIVFVTVHDEYMEHAFALHALDYLRKPFTDDRFFDALDHARRRIAERRGYEATRAGVISVLSAIRERAGRPADRVVIRVAHERSYRVLRTVEIDWVEAHEKMARVHVGNEAIAWAKTLSEVERALDPATFMRVSRSAIVNKAKILGLEPLWKGEFAIRLRSGKTIGTGRTYQDVVRSFLGYTAP